MEIGDAFGCVYVLFFFHRFLSQYGIAQRGQFHGLDRFVLVKITLFSDLYLPNPKIAILDMKYGKLKIQSASSGPR